jgi:predicted hotdog family 3-hydroxylacyl-ACP dehydratase
MLIRREELCSLIPHSGDMCLLDGVSDWDEESIVCTASSHLAPSNPLRQGGRLACVHLLEYGAQAVAVHGGLLARRDGHSQGPGYLASLQDVRLQCEFLDGVTTALEVLARKLAISDACLMYKVTINAQGLELASARVTIALQPNEVIS